LGVHNNEFILGKACIGSENHWNHKSSKMCELFSTNCTHFKIVHVDERK